MEWKTIIEKMDETAVTKHALSSEIQELTSDLEHNAILLDDLTECLAIIQIAAQETQNVIKGDVEDIVTSALAIIPFKQQYEFSLKFVLRRNTTECDLLFKLGDQEMEPLESNGYGAADIASFALRIAYWKLSGKLRNFMAIDEPFSNLDKDKHKYAAEMVRRISDEFQIQFLISSHEPSLIDAADRIFEVSQVDGRSYVEQRESP